MQSTQHCVGTQQTAWIDAIFKAHFAAKASKLAFTLRFVPQLPQFESLRELALSDFLLLPVTIWAPHVTFRGLCARIQCSSCCGTAFSLKGRADPRFIRGLNGPELLVASKYLCKSAQCGKIFLASHDVTMKSLGPVILDRAPFLLTHSSGVTKE